MGQTVPPKQVSFFWHGKLHSSHKSVTAPWMLNWLAEIIVRKTVSMVPPQAQKCIDIFPPPLLISVPRDNGLVARKTGCPRSPKFYHHQSDYVPFSLLSAIINRIPLLVWSRSKEWPSSLRKSSRITGNEVGVGFAFLFIFLRSPWDVVKLRYEDDPSCKLFWFVAHFWCEPLDFVAELRCGESCENIPLEFHWLTVKCVQSSVLWWTFEPRQLDLPDSIWL